MRICIVGLGYVGSVTASLLAKNGNSVIGVDINEEKVRFINSGKSPVTEPGLEEIMRASVQDKRLSATNDLSLAVRQSEISFICVGTPLKDNGDLNLHAVFKACHDIVRSLTDNEDRTHHILIRSTVKPGTSKKIYQELMERYELGDPISISVNPEFMREGTAVDDFLNPPFTVLGTSDNRVEEIVRQIYSFTDSQVIVTTLDVAEMIKYVNNTFHALKVSFTNEISTICKSIGIDSHDLMNLFKKDHVLNISEKYFKPGFAFGGSCLPKDLNAIKKLSNDMGLNCPIINSISASNKLQIDRLKEMLSEFKGSRIGFWGVAFKDNTDDVRESPVVEVISRLIEDGFNIRVYDSDVHASFLFGANKEVFSKYLGRFKNAFYKDKMDFLRHSDVVVVHKRFIEDPALLEGKVVIDLNYQEKLSHLPNYQGFNW